MSLTRPTILLSFAVLIAASVLAPAVAFATVNPFAAGPPVDGAGGGAGELYPWGWAVVTHTSGVAWGDDALDTKQNLTPRTTTYIAAGPQEFLAYVDKNPNGAYVPYLKLTKSGTTDVPMTIGGGIRNSLGYLTYISADGTLFSTSTTTQGWFLPCTVSTLDPGTHYSLRYLRGLKANNSATGVIYTSPDNSSNQLGYIAYNGTQSYPDESAQYIEHQYDTFQFRNAYTGTYEDFQFQFQTYADTSVFESALASAQSALTTATANSGTAPGQVDPARVAVLDSVVTSAAAVPLATMRQRLQPDVDAAVSALQAAVAQAQVLNPAVSAPVTSILGIPAGWATGTVTFSLVATGNAPPFVTSYALNGGLPAIYSGPAGVSAEGTTVVSYFSTDALSVREATKTATIRIDSVAPVTSIHGVVEDGLYAGLALFTFSAADAGSGVASTRYSIDGGADLAYTGSLLGVSGAGEHSVTFHSSDVAGNTEAAQTVEFSVSAGPPVTTISGVSASWVNTSAPVFSLTATGDAPPITTHYALNGGSDNVYSSPVTVSAQGTTTVSYRSVDSIGQAETTKTATVRYDNVKPVSSLSGVTSGGTYSAPVTLQLSATDNASGIQKIQYVLDSVQPTSTFTTPLTVSSVGAHSIVYWAMDNASNKESPAHTATFTITAAPPVTTVSGIPAGWSTGTVTFSLLATGAATPISTFYALGAGAATAYTTPVAVSTQGTTTLSYFSVDSLSQQEATKTATIRVDSAAPTTISDAVASYLNIATIHLSATDAAGGSGVAHTYYKLDGAAQVEGLTVTTGTLGAHSVEFWSVDVAGNAETPHKTASFSVADSIAPTTISDAASSYLNAATIHLSATDNAGGSGVAHTYYRLDGGTQTESLTVAVSTYGAHSIEFWSVDAAANVETPHKTANFTIDDTIAPSTTSDAVASYVDTATIHLAATDNAGGSGVGRTYYRLDGGAQTEGVTISSSAVGSHSLEFWSVDVAGNAETPHHTVSFLVTRNDGPPATTTSDALASYVGTATIHLFPAGGAAHTYHRLDSAPQAEGNTIVVTSLGAHTLEFWSVDAGGNAETPHHTVNFTITAAVSATTINIHTSAGSVRRGGSFTLTGQVTPQSLIGTNIQVMVKKPGKSYYSYSSLRTVYSNAGVASWFYRYSAIRTMAAGIYRFYATVPAGSTFLSSQSAVMSVTFK